MCVEDGEQKRYHSKLDSFQYLRLKYEKKQRKKRKQDAMVILLRITLLFAHFVIYACANR